MGDEVQPFKIQVSDEELDDLKRRLRATRWPEKEAADDWSQGVPLAYLKNVCRYWAETYDWRKTEERLNALPQFRTEVDGLGIHFLHARSPHRDALPLVMTHGWPGSIVEFLKVIPMLTDPTKHGGSAEDAFHVVCPSLPGYGFSDKPARNGWSLEKIATAWSALMLRLGYNRYFAQGGDWGAGVTTAIGLQDTVHCCGIHLNMPLARPDSDTMSSLTEEEQDWLAKFKHFEDWDSGYAKEQSTRPQTVGYGLADSPAGQAAWILEKFWAWTDSNGNPENVLTRDEMLDAIMLYWIPNSAASSARLYWESYGKWGLFDPVRVPVGCSLFPKDIVGASRRWAEKSYLNLVYWNRVDRGGHFAAFEQPELFAKELRACFRMMRADPKAPKKP
jgi:pimeloyl-ACP methyl ester carboxylesterase